MTTKAEKTTEKAAGAQDEAVRLIKKYRRENLLGSNGHVYSAKGGLSQIQDRVSIPASALRVYLDMPLGKAIRSDYSDG